MVKIKEPFFPLQNAQNIPILRNEKGQTVIYLNGKEILLFRISRTVSCHWDHYCDYTKPKEISDDLNQIFDEGNETHFEVEMMEKGARCIIDSEETMIIVHESLKFAIMGHNDYFKFSYTQGNYLEDLKSCKKESFFYFVKCIDEGLSNDYKFQMGGYAYMKYVYNGIWINKGVIRRIQKDNILNQMAISDRLPDKTVMQAFILRHPVLLTVLGIIPERKLIDVCIVQMKGQGWKCKSCQYNSQKDCPVRGVIL